LEALTESLWNKGPALEALLERTERRESKRISEAPRTYQRQKHLARDERAEVARRYVAGETIATLAAAFGCHRDAIRRALMKQNVELRNWRMKVADPARVIELYEEGQTAAQIASEFGVSATAVLNHLRGAGVVLRPRGKVPR
jgi:DNA-directed RNA polymerase specialized sigma24 family protein